MKILIIGPLGAGKSSLAYAINNKYNIPRLNLDEVSRRSDGSYYPKDEQFVVLNEFMNKHDSWVSEGCQKYLYEKISPDLIVDMRINRLLAVWRFTLRFLKAKKLVGTEIEKDLPVQPYHYRKIRIEKIMDYDSCNQKINAEIMQFIKNAPAPVVLCKRFKDHGKVFQKIDKMLKEKPLT